MAIEIKKVENFYGIYNGYNCEFFRWQDLWLNEKEVKDYIKENPFPKDEDYTLEDFLHDLKAEGTIIIPTEKKETAEYICDLISNLI